MDRRRRRSRDDYDDYEDEREERYDRYGSYQKTTPIIPFLIVGAVVVGVGMIIILSANKSAQEQAAQQAANSTRVIDNVPDPPGYQKLRDVDASGVKSASSMVIGVYPMGQHSKVHPVKRASQGYWNHDVMFVIADHDITRLTLNDLASSGALKASVNSADCPLYIFLRNGSEVYRQQGMDYDALQRQIDNLFHGGKSSMPSL
jgi:hypothetical protein